MPPTAATCSRRDASRSPTTPRTCARTSRSARPTSAKSDAPHLDSRGNSSELAGAPATSEGKEPHASTDESRADDRPDPAGRGAGGGVRQQQEELELDHHLVLHDDRVVLVLAGRG